MKRAAYPLLPRGGMLSRRRADGSSIRACVADAEREGARHLAHGSDRVRFRGAHQTRHRLETSAFCPGYPKDCLEYAATRHVCRLRGTLGAPPRGTFPYAEVPWPLVAVDSRQMARSTQGDIRISVAICRSAKFGAPGRLPEKLAATAADFLFREVLARYGVARYMLSDSGAKPRNRVGVRAPM